MSPQRRQNHQKEHQKWPQKEAKNQKKPFRVPFFSIQKKVNFPKLFFLSFWAFREALDPENHAKTL